MMGDGMGVGVREHVRVVVWREVTVVYGRIWKRYDRIRSRSDTIVIRSQVLWRNTVVYDTVYDRLRPFTESIIVDLGNLK